VTETSPFDVFHRLIRQALGEGRAGDESLDLQVFEAEDVPGAAVVKFFPEELAESLHAVYVPAGLDEDGSLMERLHAAVATHEDLVPVRDPDRQRAMLTEVRRLLERYLEASDEDDIEDPSGAVEPSGDAGQADDAAEDAAEDSTDDDADEEADDGTPPARIEFGPLEALQALGAARDGGPVPVDAAATAHDAEAGDASTAGAEPADEPLPDDRPTFRALALDILAGVPRPHGSAPELVDSFEVWAYRHDPIATVVLRYFDGGRATVLGALAPDDDAFDAGRFFAAAYQLLATKAPQTIDGATEGRLSDLEPLGTAAAMERLGRALGHEHTADIRELTTDLLGEASQETQDAYEEVRLLDPRAPASASQLFDAIARDVVDVGGDVLWTKRKEREGLPRIEVLQHVSHPRALLLIDFGGSEDPVEIAAYVPGAPGTGDAFAAAVRELVESRDLHGAPRPLPDLGPFRRVPNPQAVFAVESALDALEGGEGHALAFRPGPP
jgi:hypothetical protein